MPPYCCRCCHRQLQQVSGRHSYWTRLHNHTTDPLSYLTVFHQVWPQVSSPSWSPFQFLGMRIMHRYPTATHSSFHFLLLLRCFWLHWLLLGFCLDYGCGQVADTMSSSGQLFLTEDMRGHWGIQRYAQPAYGAKRCSVYCIQTPTQTQTQSLPHGGPLFVS